MPALALPALLGHHPSANAAAMAEAWKPLCVGRVGILWEALTLLVLDRALVLEGGRVPDEPTARRRVSLFRDLRNTSLRVHVMERFDMGSRTGGCDRPDGTALDALYREHSAWLIRRLRRILGRHADAAEDIAHDAYLRIARYDPEDAGRHPRALLSTVGTNLSRDYLRREGHAQRLAEYIARLDVNAASPTQEADLTLRDVILSLPTLYRDAFLMSRFTPLTNKEIGARLNISVKTVEWRISRAVEICAAHIDQGSGDR